MADWRLCEEIFWLVSSVGVRVIWVGCEDMVAVAIALTLSRKTLKVARTWSRSLIRRALLFTNIYKAAQHKTQSEQET